MAASAQQVSASSNQTTPTISSPSTVCGTFKVIHGMWSTYSLNTATEAFLLGSSAPGIMAGMSKLQVGEQYCFKATRSSRGGQWIEVAEILSPPAQ